MKVPSLNRQRPLSLGLGNWLSCLKLTFCPNRRIDWRKQVSGRSNERQFRNAGRWELPQLGFQVIKSRGLAKLCHADL
jgi:hypothetical protein